jgi:hypothetical protein
MSDKDEVLLAEDNLKTFAVNFKFPELIFKHMYQSATAKAGDAGTAVNRAWKEVKQRQGVKRHRITTMQITVVMAEK